MTIDFQLSLLSKSEILLGVKFDVIKIMNDISDFQPENEEAFSKLKNRYLLQFGFVFLSIGIEWGF